MRELKYKFWDREEKRMIGPNLDSERYCIGSYNGLALFDTEREDEDGYTYQMDVEFLQYTGLKDRNGKEIYEGDVLRHVNPHWGHKEVQLRVVEWENKTADNGQLMNCGFAFKAVGKGYFTFYSPENDLEIIDNIYENPSLLEDTP